MTRSHIFRRRIGIGLGAVSFLALLIGVVSLLAVNSVVETKDVVISNYARDLIQAREFEMAAERTVASERALSTCISWRIRSLIRGISTARRRSRSATTSVGVGGS